jgi:DNA repair protein RecO (recombination protein O)
MDVSETEAIILNCRDYGESDRIVAFYGEAAGMLKGIARGARRSKKRFVNTFEPCSLVDLTYRARKGLVWIDACTLLDPHLSLRGDVARWGHAALVSEIMLEMVPEGERQPELFSLLKKTLEQLAKTRDPVNAVLLFLLRFLHIMGYLPALENCEVCHRPLKTAKHWGWKMNQGSLVCMDHLQAGGDRLPLDLGTLVLMQQARRLALTNMWRLRFSQYRKVPLFNALLGLVREHIKKELKSLRLLDQLGSV